MDATQKQELTSLRDAFRRNKSQLESLVIKDYMADFLRDSGLRKLLMTDVSTRAVWYCLCNNNADRELLIGKLYSYYIKKGCDDKAALWLVSVVLFLGGVDFQLNPIDRPNQQNEQPSSPNSMGGIGNGGTKKAPASLLTTTKKNSKRLVGVAIVAVAVLIIVLILVPGSKGEGGGDNSKYSKEDLCRTYNGYIEKDNNKKICRLSVSIDFDVTVYNIYKLDDTQTYSAKLDDDELKLKNGPRLRISKTKQGRIELYYEDKKKLEKWEFVSK